MLKYLPIDYFCKFLAMHCTESSAFMSISLSPAKADQSSVQFFSLHIGNWSNGNLIVKSGLLILSVTCALTASVFIKSKHSPQLLLLDHLLLLIHAVTVQ